MTKKIQFFTLTLCLSLLGFVNTAKAVTTYTLTTGANPTVVGSWHRTIGGAAATSFALNGQLFQFTGALNPNVTLSANWTISGSGSGVSILSGVTFSDGGHTFNSGISAAVVALTIANGANVTLSGNGNITNTTLNGTLTLSGTATCGNVSINAGALLTVSGAATLSGVDPISGTLTISNASATVSSLNVQSGGVVNLNSGVTVSSIGANSGSTINFNNVAATIGSALTASAGSTVVYNPAGSSIFPTIYSGSLIVNGASSLSGPTSADGSLTLNADLTLSSNQFTIGGVGTISGAGNIVGDISAEMDISSTATVGTLNFKAGSQVLNIFDMSGSSASTSVTLGTNLSIFDDGNLTSKLDLSNGTLNLNGKTLTTDVSCWTINLGGTITGSATSVLKLNCVSGGTVAGSLMMDQTTDGSTNALSNLTFNDLANVNTLALGNNLDIIDSICPKAGTIDPSVGGLVLVADQTTVGHVGRIGMVTGAIGGNVLSEIYHSPPGNQTNWVLMGVAGITDGTFAAWNHTLKITCGSCPDGDGSAQNSGTPFTSIDSYSEPAATGNFNAAAHFVPIPSIGTTIADGAGYWVYMGNSQPGTGSSAELVTVTGTPKTGSFGWTLTNNSGGVNDGWNALSNPYPSPISWAKVALRNSNAITTYYAYNSITQDYSIYNTTTGETPSGTYHLTDVIPAGMGFYVQTMSSSMGFNTDEGDKTAGNQYIGKMANPNSVQSVASYFSLMVDGANANIHQEATISFNPNSVVGLDGYDAIAMPWNGVLQITSASQGYNFAINSLPALTQNYAIPVKILSGTTTQYTISARNLQNIPAGACLKLHDNYGIMADQDLHAGAFTVTVNDTETVARFVLNVTITPLAITTNTVSASCHAKNDGLITVVGNDAGPWNYIWKNASGTVVKTSLNKATADTLTGLNNGVYSVDVSTVGSCNSATQTFTVTAPGAAAAAFTSPSQVNTGDNVVLTNNSANATNYVWNFGDGDISSMQTPTYVYNNAGTYTITLQAINANCNDTASFTQVITVNATMGIKQANTGDGDINLSRDVSGNYIQFNYTNQTKVSIAVYNVLGQVVLNDAELSVVNDKIYINIANDKNQVLYVTITNLNTNKQTTKKFLND
jgi:PKD repeat protein